MYRPSDIARGIEDAIYAVTRGVSNHITSKREERRTRRLARRLDDMAKVIAATPELRTAYRAALFDEGKEPAYVQALMAAAKKPRTQKR
jgi:hypothetical protein